MESTRQVFSTTSLPGPSSFMVPNRHRSMHVPHPEQIPVLTTALDPPEKASRYNGKGCRMRARSGASTSQSAMTILLVTEANAPAMEVFPVPPFPLATVILTTHHSEPFPAIPKGWNGLTWSFEREDCKNPSLHSSRHPTLRGTLEAEQWLYQRETEIFSPLTFFQSLISSDAISSERPQLQSATAPVKDARSARLNFRTGTSIPRAAWPPRVKVMFHGFTQIPSLIEQKCL